MSKTGRQIFRQAALDRLSSPEQLDQLVVITDTRGWLALSTLFVLVGAISAWGFLGVIPDDVTGNGILMGAGGRVVDVSSPGSGRISGVDVEVEQNVVAGQKLGTISQTSLAESLISAQQALTEKQIERDNLAATFTRQFEIQQRNANQQVTFQQQIIAAATARASYLESSLKKQEALAADGLVPRDRIEQLRSDYDRVSQEVSSAQIRVLELEAATLDLEATQARALVNADQRVSTAERLVRELSSRLGSASRILAPADGRVTEIKLFEGDAVTEGQSLLSIETSSQDLEVILYVPTADGKRIMNGMLVRVEPATVRKEEFGTIVGRVSDVSDFPATREGMLAVVQNSDLVRAYSAAGAPYTARVSLLKDSATPSGFKWTSGAGPAMGITSGTTVRAEITVRERRPVDLIIPFVRKHTGIGHSSGVDH